MSKKGHNSNAQLKSIIERVSNLQDEIKAANAEYVKPLRDDIQDILKEAEGNGWDKKAIKEAVRRYKMDEDLRGIVETYEAVVLQDVLGD